MKTIDGRGLTARGYQPVCPFRHKFVSHYISGAFCVHDGTSLLLEQSHCSGEMFQHFLDKLSQQETKSLCLLIVDNAGFHKAKALRVPDNIVLIFQPPYSPEVNAAEKVWWSLKRAMHNRFFKTIDELREQTDKWLKALTQKQIKDIVAFDYVLEAIHYRNL